MRFLENRKYAPGSRSDFKIFVRRGGDFAVDTETSYAAGCQRRLFKLKFKAQTENNLIIYLKNVPKHQIHYFTFQLKKLSLVLYNLFCFFAMVNGLLCLFQLIHFSRVPNFLSLLQLRIFFNTNFCIMYIPDLRSFLDLLTFRWRVWTRQLPIVKGSE